VAAIGSAARAGDPRARAQRDLAPLQAVREELLAL
jgi:hypothetical protein